MKRHLLRKKKLRGMVSTMLRQLRSFPRPETRPFKLLQIEPTMRWPEFRASKADMSRDTFAHISRYFSLTEGIDLTGGGEPLLHPELMPMIEAGKAGGCSVGFNTNGVLINSELAGKLVALDVDWIAYSVDAATPQTYEAIRRGAKFNQVLDNIAAVKEAKEKRGGSRPLTMIVFVMMRDNIFELPTMIDLASQMGIDHVIAKNLDVILKEDDENRRIFTSSGAPPPVEAKRAIAEAQARAKRHDLIMRVYNLQPEELAICDQDPVHTLFVNWEGWVSPCITLSYAKKRIFCGNPIELPIHRFGNVNDEELPDIWNKTAYQEFRRVFEGRSREVHRAKLKDNARSPKPSALPPAPAVCQACHYLYNL
jgi:MoaA/NifB/PqqE/SkfB family radical SAM enzyme